MLIFIAFNDLRAAFCGNCRILPRFVRQQTGNGMRCFLEARLRAQGYYRGCQVGDARLGNNEANKTRRERCASKFEGIRNTRKALSGVFCLRWGMAFVERRSTVGPFPRLW